MYFTDRHEAGRLLAALLEEKVDRSTLIYALPRGGVPVAVEVALALHQPLDLVIARKIGHPMQPECAVCAVTEHGKPIVDERQRAHLDPLWLERRIQEERAEARRRRERYCGPLSRRSANGHRVVLIDDGIATGLSMEAALQDLLADGPKHVIVAVPVAPIEAVDRLKRKVDEFICAEAPARFAGSVGAYYENFAQLRDEDVLRDLQRLPPDTYRPTFPHSTA